MVRRKMLTEPQLPIVPPDKGISLLQSQIEKAKQLLLSHPLNMDDYSSWKLLTKNFLEKAFGIASPNVSSIMNVGVGGSFPINAGEEYWENQRAENLQTQIKKLEALVEVLKSEVQFNKKNNTDQAAVPVGYKLFLVHGHNEKALHEIARYLEKLQQDVVILREQPNEGRTIIEKFEDYAEVGFAVVLLTADDRGAASNVLYDAQKPAGLGKMSYWN